MNQSHDAIVDRSWATLQNLRRRYQFVLLGGWAAWLLTKRAKSHDIDILVDFSELGRLRSDYPALKANHRLKKYEIPADGFDIDIYVPHYSTTLALPPEYVQQRTLPVEGFRVPTPPVLLALKLGAWRERRNSDKGQKDLEDIRGLLPLVSGDEFRAVLQESGVDPERAASLLAALEEAERDTHTKIPREAHREKGTPPKPSAQPQEGHPGPAFRTKKEALAYARRRARELQRLGHHVEVRVVDDNGTIRVVERLPTKDKDQ